MNNATSSHSVAHATGAQNQTTHSSGGSKKSLGVDFTGLVKQMEGGQMTPREVSEGRNHISAELARMRWRYGALAARRAKFVVSKKDGYKSMAETERVWEATEDGQVEVQLHHQIKALEVLLEALETNWFLIQGELRSQV